ncbi:MAG: type 1 glutamine amidotransferase [Planctomycetia bacterium]|nr:type 1 glutamine amidotransferase [Planctomycetia bacterium]
MSGITVLRHVPRETLGILEHVFLDAGLDWRYVDLFDAVSERLDLAGAAGLVVLGGPMSVNDVDANPWLADEVRWIRQAVDAELPVLGICLGAQLLAKSLGAKVRANPVKEIGWYRLELTEEAAGDPLFGGCGARYTVFQSHGDTFALPDGAVHLARGEECENQAFRRGRLAWGLQFHIEMTEAMVREWLDEPGTRRLCAELDYIDPDAIRADTSEALPKMRVLADHILPRFAALCVQR